MVVGRRRGRRVVVRPAADRHGRRRSRLPALVFAQAHPEKRVALRRSGALQRRRRQQLVRERDAAAAATLAGGQLAAVVFDFQYLQFEESQCPDVLRTPCPKEIVRYKHAYTTQHGRTGADPRWVWVILRMHPSDIGGRPIYWSAFLRLSCSQWDTKKKNIFNLTANN